MRLLHVILVASLEDPLLRLRRMEKSKFDGYVHRIFELFDTLLHGAKVGGEVGSRLLFNEGEYDSELVEKIVYSVQNWV